MTDILYLAWRYLRFNWVKTAVLIASISLIFFLPLGLQVVVDQGARQLTARAESSPLLLGAKGSAVDLVLSALYFREPTVEPVPFWEVSALNAGGRGLAIPLHLRYETGGQRIVGTTLEYFDFRGLQVAEGRPLSLLGECVLGAQAAQRLGKGVGASVISTPAGAFDVAGAYPLKMNIVGVLAPRGTPDDDAVFVDVKTAWVIAGLAHGHEDVTALQDSLRLLERSEDHVVASPAVLSYNEITDENRHTFHFHGEAADFPVDAILVVPRSFRDGVMLRGEYEGAPVDVQMVVPEQVMAELLQTVFSVRDWILVASAGVLLAALLIALLVFALSIRLRRREIETIRKIGAPRRQVRAILGAEIVIVLGAALLLALGLTLVVRQFGGVLIQWL